MINRPTEPPRAEPGAAQLSALGSSSGGAAAFRSLLNSSKPMAPDPSASHPVRSLDISEHRAVPSTCHKECGLQHTSSAST